MNKLPYPRLFLRTALHIGAALAAFVLIGAASLALIAAWELRGYIATRDSSLAEEAADVLAAQGTEGLRRWLQTDAAIPPDTSIYILTDSATDILGRALPEQYLAFVQESVIGPPPDATATLLPVRLAPQLIAPDGQRLTFLVLPKGISVWGSPATLLGLALVALLVIGSVAWLIARAFSKPISELQLAVGELASGHTDVRIPAAIAARRDELGALASDFNSMAARLTELMTDREALMREMSHELRSPLARLQAAIALATERDNIPANEQQRIDKEIRRMNRVIGEMLHYSNLDTALQPKKRLVRIDRLLQEIAGDEELEAAAHHCTLNVQSESGLTVVGDPELLRSCFENVIRNSIRYTREDSTVKITAREATGESVNARHIVVNIADRGPGVATEHLDKIFEPWFRVASGGHHKDSTGLGLAIVKRVLKLHDGQVQASQRSGGGLQIHISLPAADMS